MRHASIALLFLPWAMLTAFPAEFCAAPNASGGDGSLSRPLDLRTALSQKTPLQPGDILYLRGGVYTGKFESYLTGTPGQPITVQSYPGEWARLDSGISNDRHNIL